jgi:hypothetical protein
MGNLHRWNRHVDKRTRDTPFFLGSGRGEYFFLRKHLTVAYSENRAKTINASVGAVPRVTPNDYPKRF